MPVARERLATIPYDAPLIEAAKLLSRAEVNLVVVCDSSNALAGVITRTDVALQISPLRRKQLHDGRFGRHDARGDVLPSRGSADLRLVDHEGAGLKHVPIVDKSARPLGVLYARDALQVLLREVEYEELLRDYVMGVGYR